MAASPTETRVSYAVAVDDHADVLADRFGKLLISQSMVDVKLVSSEESVCVHRIVLAASSPYLKERIEDGVANVILFKCPFSVVCALVEFMYFGKTAFSTEDGVFIASAARFLGLRGLEHYTPEDGLLPSFEPPLFLAALTIDDIQTTTQDIQEIQKLDAACQTNSDFQCVARFPVIFKDPSRISFSKKRGRPKKIQEVENDNQNETIEYDTHLTKRLHEMTKPQRQSADEELQELPKLSVDWLPATAEKGRCDTVEYLNSLLIDCGESDFVDGIPPMCFETMSCGSSLSQCIDVMKNSDIPENLPVLFEFEDGCFLDLDDSENGLDINLNGVRDDVAINSSSEN